MADYSLTKFVPEYFQFLIDEYGFSIAHAADDVIIYQSQNCKIKLDIDRRGYSIRLLLCPIESFNEWIGFDTVIDYLSQKNDQKIEVYIDPGRVPISKVMTGQLTHLSKLLRSNFRQILPLFRPSVFKHIQSEFKKIGRKRYEERKRAIREKYRR